MKVILGIIASTQNDSFAKYVLMRLVVMSCRCVEGQAGHPLMTQEWL